MSKILILIFSIFILLFNQILRLSANDDTYINSSNITYNENENIVQLAENSKINYKNTNILIDKGIIDYNTDTFKVFGNFYLYEELTILSGQNLKGNTSLDTFQADNVSYIYNDDLKIDSERIDRKNNEIYFYNNFLTPCELEGYFNCPTWSLRINKTKYNIEDDKFTHFNSFLQIADYKIFYLPYFTHYGTKAPRKRGFLTPTIEFTIGRNQGVKTPYYLPLSNSSDLIITPKFFLNSNMQFIEKYELNTFFESKSSGGLTNIEIDNIKNQNNKNINTSIRFNTKKVLNKNKIFSSAGIFTNSISTTRSINEEPITFEDIYLRLENYDILSEDDYLKTEIASVESFESNDIDTVPFSPSISYFNQIEINEQKINNKLDFTILKRKESSTDAASENLKLSIINDTLIPGSTKNLKVYNKLTLFNSMDDYYFNNNIDLNGQAYKSLAILSSDLYYSNIKKVIPRLKFILPLQLNNTNKSINEDSQSITFNYQNQFADSRFFGFDIFDSSPRITYGIESVKLLNDKVEFKINQSYEIKKNNSYLNKINQEKNFSDFAIEAKTSFKNLGFRLDSRISENNFSKKEMNYAIDLNGPINLSLNYNETKADAFKNLSSDTQSLQINMSKIVNDNISMSYGTNLDVKNNYDPYKSVFKLSFFDECSRLDISYSNTRFNDDYNTQPEELISFKFYMDYLGFFGYQQTTDLFFEEAGNINYGL